MKRLKDRIGRELLFFDGALGTQLQAMGLAPGECPEVRSITTPELVYQIHREYLAAGADIVLANTFGANRLKLDSRYSVEQVVGESIAIAKKAIADSGREAYVALDIGPTGKLLKPYGELELEEAYSVFAQLVNAGAAAGADMVSIETMTDLYEIKAAMLAVKENCELPLTVTVSFDGSGKLLTGANVAVTTTLIASLGADAVGINCGSSPSQSFELLKEMGRYTSLPLVFCPNAGLPVLRDGVQEYTISADELAVQMKQVGEWGAAMLGGCCGTTPEHIRRMTELCRGLEPMRRAATCDDGVTYVTSQSRAVPIGAVPVVIGERLNPTGKPKLKAALRNGDMEHIRSEALTEEENGADILDINAGLPELDEAEAMCDMISAVQSVCELPLQIDTASPEVLERALRLYNGRPLVNSVNGKRESMERVLPLVKKYGACVVALTLDENGIPDTAQGRVAIAERIVSRAAEYGIPRRDIIVDTLTMTVGTCDTNACVTLEALEYVSRRMKLKTVLGVSNVSFGLPERASVTATFLTMALQRGLSAAIVNPSSATVMNAFGAYLALSGQDASCLRYIGSARRISEPGASDTVMTERNASVATQGGTLKAAVIKGLKGHAADIASAQIERRGAMELIENEIMPALNEVGEGFANKTLFLPQLIMSSEAARAAFAVIREHMKRSGGEREEKGGVILATVKGDIHDIGKNIVKALLENYGFDVLDLGKDVSPEAVLDAARDSGIRLIGLSALMTTTVPAMEETVSLLHRELPGSTVMVGGAVLNDEYARAIGAEYYCPDAMATVRFAEEYYAKRAPGN